MSFSADPFAEFTIEQVSEGFWKWRCGSCGGTGSMRPENAPLTEHVLDYYQHLKRSHKLHLGCQHENTLSAQLADGVFAKICTDCRKEVVLP